MFSIDTESYFNCDQRHHCTKKGADLEEIVKDILAYLQEREVVARYKRCRIQLSLI